MRAAIPTKYKGFQFRSMLEAKWAAFFDLLKWPWEYEPMELNGYIPDFILQFPQPLLVEVKPVFSLKEMEGFREKIERSGWKKEVLIVGATVNPHQDCREEGSFGLLADQTELSGEWSVSNHDAPPLLEIPSWDWGVAIISKTDHWALRHSHNSWHCRVCGERHYSQDSPQPRLLWTLWSEAHNETKWNFKG